MQSDLSEEWTQFENKINMEPNSEGAVVSYLDYSGNVVYVAKHKNYDYVFMRACRECMRKRFNSNMILQRINNLHIDHPNQNELTKKALQFNAYYRSLNLEDQ